MVYDSETQSLRTVASPRGLGATDPDVRRQEDTCVPFPVTSEYSGQRRASSDDRIVVGLLCPGGPICDETIMDSHVPFQPLQRPHGVKQGDGGDHVKVHQ